MVDFDPGFIPDLMTIMKVKKDALRLPLSAMSNTFVNL